MLSFLLAAPVTATQARSLGDVVISEPRGADWLDHKITASCGREIVSVQFRNDHLRGGQMRTVAINGLKVKGATEMLNARIAHGNIDDLQFMGCMPARSGGMRTRWMMQVKGRSVPAGQLFFVLAPERLSFLS